MTVASPKGDSIIPSWRDDGGKRDAVMSGPVSSELVSDVAPQTGSGSPSTPVGSSPPAAHRWRLPWVPARAFLIFVHPRPSILKVFTHIAAEQFGRDRASPPRRRKGRLSALRLSPVHGFLTQAKGPLWACTPYRRVLDKNSPSYMGSVAGLFTPMMVNKYHDLAALVRNGGGTDHTLTPNGNVWVQFRTLHGSHVRPASKHRREACHHPGEPGEGSRHRSRVRPVRYLCCRPQPSRPKSLSRFGKTFLKSPEKMP
jgi:hypothetical protein